MQTVSFVLIVIGLAIIAVVLMMRWRLRRRQSMPSHLPILSTPPRAEPDDFDPLFALDRPRAARELNELPAIHAEPDEPVLPETTSPRMAIEPEAVPMCTPAAVPSVESAPQRATIPSRRSAPRMASDPERVIAMNVVAPEGQRFSGEAIAAAAQHAGLELGTWSIYHYYSQHAPKAPPLFSMANMVKPGSFDPQQMHEVRTVGLSLFMVPANDEHDLATFDVMLATVRQLASDLGGEVRDAHRSVLTKQGIDHLREQLKAWRFKAQAAQS